MVRPPPRSVNPDDLPGRPDRLGQADPHEIPCERLREVLAIRREEPEPIPAATDGEAIEEGPRHRVDRVEIDDAMLGGVFALGHRVHHEEIPDIAIRDIPAEALPGLRGGLLVPRPLSPLPASLEGREQRGGAEDDVRDLAVFQVARQRHHHVGNLQPI